MKLFSEDHHAGVTKTIGSATDDVMPTPTQNAGLVKNYGDFQTLVEALDYAAQGETGINFFSARGGLESVHPYAGIRNRVIQQARQLNSLGLKPQDRVGIVADMTIDFITLFLACQYAGLLAVPLPVVTGLGGRQEYETQLLRVIKTSNAKLALGPESSRKSLEAAAADLDLLLIGTVDDLEKNAGEDGELRPLGPDDPSHIQFSSGSTRKPLGVLISQKSLMANAQSVAKDGLKFNADDRVASWLPFYHDMGLIGFLLIPLTSQMSIDYIHTDGFARRPISWLKMISDNKATITFSPTFGYEICTRRAARRKEINLDLSCLRVAGIGGEMVQPDVLLDFANTFSEYGFDPAAFVPSYGMAEATLAFSFSPLGQGCLEDAVSRAAIIDKGLATPAPAKEKTPDDKDERETGTRIFAKCGAPMPGYEVKILNDEGEVLSDRQVGNIFVKGPSLMTCYDLNPDATGEVLTRDGWLNTGDMGYLVDGTLVITGRMKDLIIINGRNIWPQDLEWHAEENVEALKSRSTAAFSVEDEKGREIPVILVQCRTTDPDLQNAIKQDVRAAIFRNAGIDAKVILIPNGSLPFTTSGKLSRSKAKKDYLKGLYPEMGKDVDDDTRMPAQPARTG